MCTLFREDDSGSFGRFQSLSIQSRLSFNDGTRSKKKKKHDIRTWIVKSTTLSVFFVLTINDYTINQQRFSVQTVFSFSLII